MFGNRADKSSDRFSDRFINETSNSITALEVRVRELEEQLGAMKEATTLSRFSILPPSHSNFIATQTFPIKEVLELLLKDLDITLEKTPATKEKTVLKWNGEE